MLDRTCRLYKRIMKRESNAIDEIETLEDAKEIIKMMASNACMEQQIQYLEWKKRVTCPNCNTTRLVEFGQQKCKCHNCKTIYTIRR